MATIDHNVPTTDRSLPMIDETSSTQIKTLEKNCKDFGIKLFGINDPNQGIVHVIGPQLGITLPGSTIVCGDSHTSTQGAFGAILGALNLYLINLNINYFFIYLGFWGFGVMY